MEHRRFLFSCVNGGVSQSFLRFPEYRHHLLILPRIWSPAPESSASLRTKSCSAGMFRVDHSMKMQVRAFTLC
jgi:hypothetical protein